MIKPRSFVLLFLLSSLLSACTGLHFSPEAAATSAVLHSPDPNFAIDPESMQLHQTLEMSDESRVVILSFQGTRSETGPQSCVYAYHVQKTQLGWQPASGGGGCRTTMPTEDAEPIEIGAGQSSSGEPGDPGFSQVYGLVNQAEIVKVRVTWSDDQVDEVEVINASYAVARLGLFDIKQVEGLNDQGQQVYDHNPQIAPGKQ